MKIYTDRNKEANSSIEISLNHQELKNLVNCLTDFDHKIDKFQNANIGKENLGFAHLHLKDCGLIEENSKTDIVLYIDLNDK